MNKNDILNELVHRQRKDVYYNKKLSYRDLNRILKYINESIFGKNCCIWNGYISSSQNETSYYINFFFKNKKTNLQKLLYLNYVGSLEKKSYIKYSCETGGKCCNTAHFIKHTPSENNKSSEESSSCDSSDSQDEMDQDNGEDFIVRF